MPIPRIESAQPSPMHAAPPVAVAENTETRAVDTQAAQDAARPSPNLQWIVRGDRDVRPVVKPVLPSHSAADPAHPSPAASASAPAVAPTPVPADDTAMAPSPFPPVMVGTSSELRKATDLGTVQAAPSLVVEITSPPRIKVGNVASYDVYVKNMGAVTARDVDVDASIPEQVEFVGSKPVARSSNDRVLRFHLGDLAAEAVRRIHVDFVPQSAGVLRLQANVGFSISASSEVQVDASQLAIRCTTPSEAHLGELVAFHITVRNTGEEQAEHVTIVPQVASDDHADLSAAGQFDMGVLQPGDTKEIVLRAVAQQKGTMRVRFVASDQFGSEAIADTQVKVSGNTLDVLVKGPAAPRPGKENEYEIYISNLGQSAAQNVRVTCSLPPGLRLTFVEHTAQLADNFSRLTWYRQQLPAGVTEVLRFKARADTEGQYTIRTVLRSDALPVDTTAETTIDVREPTYQDRTASFP